MCVRLSGNVHIYEYKHMTEGLGEIFETSDKGDTRVIPLHNIVDKGKLLWWNKHWLSKVFTYEQVAFIDPKIPHYDTENGNDLDTFISDSIQIIKELYCVVLYTLVPQITDIDNSNNTSTETDLVVLDIIIPCLLNQIHLMKETPSFLNRRPNLANLGLLKYTSHERHLGEYCEELRDYLGTHLYNPVNFWDSKRGESIIDHSNIIIVSQFNWKYISEKYTIEYPTRDNPELISTIKKRLKLLEFVKSITCKDAFIKLQKDTTTCICNPLFDYFNYMNVVCRHTNNERHSKGNVPLCRETPLTPEQGTQVKCVAKCKTLVGCVSKCTKTLYLFMRRENSFCSDLFEEPARKEDITGLFWLVLSTFCTPILQSEVPVLEALFTFFKLQIYSWTESELLQTVSFNFTNSTKEGISRLDYSSLCGNLGKKHLVTSDLETFDFFRNNKYPSCTKNTSTDKRSNIRYSKSDDSRFILERYYYRHCSKTPLSEGRQYPSKLLTTLVKEYHCMESCTSSMFALEYPGMVYSDYTKLPVYFACLTFNFITSKIREFRRTVISPALDYSIIEHYSDQRYKDKTHPKGIEITNSLLESARTRIGTETRNRMNKVHPDFYENIFKPVFDNSPDNYKRNNSQLSHTSINYSHRFNESTTTTTTNDLLGNKLRDIHNNSLLGNGKVKFGINTRSVRRSVSRNASGVGSDIIREVTHEDIVNSPQVKELLDFKNNLISKDEVIVNFNERERTRNLLHGIDPFPDNYSTHYERFDRLTKEDNRLILSPCIRHLLETIQRENTHPNYDERFFIIAYFMDLGLHPVQIAEVFKTLLTDLDEYAMTTTEFLSTSTAYGVPFINVIKSLVKFRLSSDPITTISDYETIYTSFEEWRQEYGGDDENVDEEYYHFSREVKTIPSVVGLNCCKIIGKGLCPIKPSNQQSYYAFGQTIQDIEELDNVNNNSRNVQSCSCKVSHSQPSHLSIKLQCAQLATSVNLENLEKLDNITTGAVSVPVNDTDMEDLGMVNIPFSSILSDANNETHTPQVIIHKRRNIGTNSLPSDNLPLKPINHPMMYINNAQRGLM